MDMYFYIVPSEIDATHHGVLGMKWGIRRYQPYSVVPRQSGKTGKEIGLASRSAEKNVKSAIKNIKNNYTKNLIYESKVERYEEKKKKRATSGKNTDRIEARLNRYKDENKDAYKERKRILNEAFDKMSESDKILGKEVVDKIIKKKEFNDYMFSTAKGLAAWKAIQAGLLLTTGKIIVGLGPNAVAAATANAKNSVTYNYIKDERYNRSKGKNRR